MLNILFRSFLAFDFYLRITASDIDSFFCGLVADWTVASIDFPANIEGTKTFMNPYFLLKSYAFLVHALAF